MNPLRLLLIEDDPDDIFLFQQYLEALTETLVQLSVATSLAEGLKVLESNTYDLVVTDLYLSDSGGLDTFLEVQKKVPSLPIIIVGGLKDEELAHKAIVLGAQDYLPKIDLNADLLKRVLRFAIERQRLHESLKALSFTDELTKLYNRRGFQTFLEQHLNLAKRTKKGFFLFAIDLDYLKTINDRFGHAMGDQALIMASHCLIASFRMHDVVGRVGGDEFAVLSLNTSSESGDRLKQHLLDKVKAFNDHSNEPYQISLTIGKTYFDPISSFSSVELMKQADEDLYKEKKLRKVRQVG